MEEISMVNRVESSGKLEELDATVVAAVLEQSVIGNSQYKITLKPHGIKSTKEWFEWIPMSRTATEEAIPQGSVMERYLTQIELCVPAAKKARTVKEAFGLLVGKKFKFRRIKLGKDFEGHPARDYFVPVQQL
jgi:hypothetical protein